MRDRLRRWRARRRIQSTPATDPLAGAFLYDVDGLAFSYHSARDEALAWDGNRSRPVSWGCWVDDGISVDRETFDRLRGLEPARRPRR